MEENKTKELKAGEAIDFLKLVCEVPDTVVKDPFKTDSYRAVYVPQAPYWIYIVILKNGMSDVIISKDDHVIKRYFTHMIFSFNHTDRPQYVLDTDNNALIEKNYQVAFTDASDVSKGDFKERELKVSDIAERVLVTDQICSVDDNLMYHDTHGEYRITTGTRNFHSIYGDALIDYIVQHMYESEKGDLLKKYNYDTLKIYCPEKYIRDYLFILHVFNDKNPGLSKEDQKVWLTFLDDFRQVIKAMPMYKFGWLNMVADWTDVNIIRYYNTSKATDTDRELLSMSINIRIKDAVTCKDIERNYDSISELVRYIFIEDMNIERYNLSQLKPFCDYKVAEYSYNTSIAVINGKPYMHLMLK